LRFDSTADVTRDQRSEDEVSECAVRSEKNL